MKQHINHGGFQIVVDDNLHLSIRDPNTGETRPWLWGRTPVGVVYFVHPDNLDALKEDIDARAQAAAGD